jgi:hypothetical protein
MFLNHFEKLPVKLEEATIVNHIVKVDIQELLIFFCGISAMKFSRQFLNYLKLKK